jgi:hypothetical protein
VRPNLPAAVEIPRRKVRIGQLSSHRGLMHDVSQVKPTQSGRRQPLDAIIVPTARRADQMIRAIQLAADAETTLVVLGSQQSKIDEVAAHVARIPGSRALIVDVPAAYPHPYLTPSASSDAVRSLSAGRDSDLSLKRNIGLLLARLLGWNKIMFLDDDVTVKDAEDLTKLASQLDGTQVAGLLCRQFPDNSVVCHANRLRGEKQDVFLTGAALGVNCADQPLPFFPDIYNEDWFFFSGHAAHGRLPAVGTAVQRQYDPFADPDRARREEFGDLLAEGLYALMSTGLDLSAAGRSYWEAFSSARQSLIEDIAANLRDRLDSNENVQALRSMEAAAAQAALITPDDCVEFIEAWRHDRHIFEHAAARIGNVGSFADAFDFLELPNWRAAAFAHTDLSKMPSVLEFSRGRDHGRSAVRGAPPSVPVRSAAAAARL